MNGSGGTATGNRRLEQRIVPAGIKPSSSSSSHCALVAAGAEVGVYKNDKGCSGKPVAMVPSGACFYSPEDKSYIMVGRYDGTDRQLQEIGGIAVVRRRRAWESCSGTLELAPALLLTP